MRNWTIYMYVFPNGKRYIGKTCRKMIQRQHSDWSGYKRCTLLWKAIQRYGVENIKTVILEERVMEDSESGEIERFYIDKYKTNCNRHSNPSYGYNLTDGGEGVSGVKLRGEDYEKRVKQLRGAQKAYLDRGVSEETRKKYSEAKIGKKRGPMSEETKAKIGYKNSLACISDDQRERRSKSKMKKVLALNTETGEKIIFDCVHEAAKYFSVRDSAVSRWCSKTRNPSIPYKFDLIPPTTTERKSC